MNLCMIIRLCGCLYNYRKLANNCFRYIFLNNVLSCHVAISDFYLFKRSFPAYLVTMSICLLNKIICA